MKILVQYHHHQPSENLTALVHEQLGSLSGDLQIEKAHVHIEHRVEASPPFRITAHLVTPGPDVFAEAIDHTTRAALGKMMGQLKTRIEHRHQKRAQRGPQPLKTSARRTVA